MTRYYPPIFLLFLLSFSGPFLPLSRCQMITGNWKGKINRQKVEIKIIQNGDSLTGTSYYFESPNNYRRYSIRGYFDEATNAAVWWDDQLISEKSGKLSLGSPGRIPMLSRADFNCPGSGKMMLDGKSAERDDEMKIRGDVHLDKTGNSEFKDEWDFVIDNYTTGANDPEIIDSIGTIAFTSFPQPVRPEEKTEQKIVQPKPIREDPIKTPEKPQPVIITKTETAKTEPVAPITKPVNPPAIEEKFVSRQKSFVKEIPVSGDSIELRFYDNAEIDGDSISLFLNDKLLFSHIRLTGNAWVFKLAVSELKETNELTMVAENMGSIPPNTSYMVAIIGDKRHDAYLASTEGSSAMIRFVKR